MATKTSGTNAATTLTSLQYPSFSATSFSEADIAAIAALIINDADPSMVTPGAFTRGGLLFIPNRGFLKMQPGDWVMVGPEGWPVLVSDIACATTAAINGTPVSGSTLMTMASSVAVAGWQIGGAISGTGIAAGTLITGIDPTNLILTLSKAATSSPGSTAITYGSWTHS